MDVVLSSQGNAIQDVMIEVATNITDAVVREGISFTSKLQPNQLLQSFVRFPADASAALIPKSLQVMSKPLLRPLTLPYELTQTLLKLSEKSIEDEQSLDNLKTVVSMINPNQHQEEGGSVDTMSINEIRKEVRNQLLSSDSLLRKSLNDPQMIEKLPVLIHLSKKFTSAVLTRVGERVDHSMIESMNSNQNNSRNNKDSNRMLQKVGSIVSKSVKKLAKVIDESSDNISINENKNDHKS